MGTEAFCSRMGSDCSKDRSSVKSFVNNERNALSVFDSPNRYAININTSFSRVFYFTHTHTHTNKLLHGHTRKHFFLSPSEVILVSSRFYLIFKMSRSSQKELFDL